MKMFKDLILAAIIVIGFLAICAIDDGREDKQMAADDLVVAQAQESVEQVAHKRDEAEFQRLREQGYLYTNIK